MTKVSFSRELLGTIKFVFDKTKSRTLNATQAYDTSTSQIVLASYPATSTINTSAKGLGRAADKPTKGAGGVSVTGTETGWSPDFATDGAVKGLGTGAASLSLAFYWMPSPLLPVSDTKQTPVSQPLQRQADIVQFGGVESFPPGGATIKSNATKEIYYGNIIVGTGLYREWQGKYAVLKVDLLTNNAILRVYNQ